jgi:hypothetical protein
MTAPTLAILAGSPPAAPKLTQVHQIGPQSRRQSGHPPCAPPVGTDVPTLALQKTDRRDRSCQTSARHTPWPNPHSTSGTAGIPPPAISCLGAFRPPATAARAGHRHPGGRKPAQDPTPAPQQTTSAVARLQLLECSFKLIDKRPSTEAASYRRWALLRYARRRHPPISSARITRDGLIMRQVADL